MILYNVSIIVEDSSHDDLFAWLNKQLKTNSFGAKFLKMLDSPHEGTTYCIQVNVEDQTTLQAFQDELLPLLQHYIASHHAEKAFIFDSKMQYLSID